MSLAWVAERQRGQSIYGVDPRDLDESQRLQFALDGGADHQRITITPNVPVAVTKYFTLTLGACKSASGVVLDPASWDSLPRRARTRPRSPSIQRRRMPRAADRAAWSGSRTSTASSCDSASRSTFDHGAGASRTRDTRGLRRCDPVRSAVSTCASARRSGRTRRPRRALVVWWACTTPFNAVESERSSPPWRSAARLR